MNYNQLSAIEKAQIATICRRNDITRPEDIEKAYNNYVEGKSIFDDLSEGYQRASAFGKFLANGGHIYDGDTEPTQQMDSRPSFPWIEMARQEEQAYQNAMQEPYFQVNGKISKDEWRERNKPRDPGQITQSKYPSGPVGLGQMIDEYVREGKYRARNGELMLSGKYGLPLAALAAGAGTAIGAVAPAVLANPYVDAGLISMGGAHAAQSLANGEADWMTALELAPMVRPAKAAYQATKPIVGPIVDAVAENAGKARTFLGSTRTGKWTQFGDDMYRLESGNLGMNGIVPKVEKHSDFVNRLLSKGWTTAEDGALINPTTKQRFVFNSEGKLQSESSLNITNNEMAKKAAKIAKVKKDEKATKNILSELQKLGFSEFEPRLWFKDREWMSNAPGGVTKEDIDIWNSHLPEYLDLAKKLKGKALYRNSKGKWIGKFSDGEKEVVPEEFIVAHSKAFNKSGLLYDGKTYNSGMSRENYEKLLNNGGLDVINWGTDNVHYAKGIASNVDFSGPRLAKSLVGKKTAYRELEPDPSIADPSPMGYDRPGIQVGETIVEYYPTGITDIPNIHPKSEPIPENWRIFGKDIQVKSLRGNNGNFDMSNPNIYKSLLIPTVLGGSYIGLMQTEDDINNSNYLNTYVR